MDQVYRIYTEWEDFKNGMYDTAFCQNKVQLSMDLLCNEGLFLSACKQVITEWPVATIVNLTNTSCNRKAWLGQASCNLIHNANEFCTRIAWGKMSLQDQTQANIIAQKVINSYLINYEVKDRGLFGRVA